MLLHVDFPVDEDFSTLIHAFNPNLETLCSFYFILLPYLRCIRECLRALHEC